MGGGDLNTKKAWHPSNYKNQERVWKAEQAAAQEKKRISELQRERAEERDREQLNEIAKRTAAGGSSPNDNRLHWMYDKPDKKVQQEDYLLGKSIDTNHDQTAKDNQDVIPAVARRVVGSSMTAMSSDTQVDLVRKLREDPLLLIKERERAARAALLNNPLQRRRLTELLRKEQDQSKMKKDEKKTKKKHNDLDNILAAKLNALGAKKGVDLKTLLASDDDSSSDSSSDQSKHKKKKDKKKKKKKKSKKQHKNKKNSDSDESEKEKMESKNDSRHARKQDKDCKLEEPQRKRKSEHKDDYEQEKIKKHRQDMTTDSKYTREKRRDTSDEGYKRSTKGSTSSHKYNDREQREKQDSRGKGRVGMSEEEKAAKLAEMAAAGAEREIQRGRRVAEQLAEKEDSEKRSNIPRSSRREAQALPDSLESRIHSNRHYIQRDRKHMNEHFARR
ncbi:PREDICTED: pre-mRNA-splicing factor CWC25 homolog [Papilio xuthus]|uniref:Pre-mRNA-splicing factor CWC25 homolog n=1 Tax=Papilio xuthus TaxID=66420 RepID=A0AAJ6ZA67_PAPXU|nr:PREDICTED: pre-mRNA-splicing factor CWC25 homolog [Papilio xuthus]